MTNAVLPDLSAEHARIRAEATRLAGKPTDLVQRSSVYFHLYQHSGGNHAFPLLAAHGALWGSGHFAKGLRLGQVMSFGLPRKNKVRSQKLAALHDFALAFKEINRQVCVETYTCYHLTALYGDHSQIGDYVPAELLAALNACHDANRSGVTLDERAKRQLFQAFFFWEQENIVGPGVDAAVAAMDWPLIMWLALKPAVGFRYFNKAKRLWFADFASKPERVQKGLDAFDLAQAAGWDHVERALGFYKIMPPQFLKNPSRHFDNILQAAPPLVQAQR